VFIKSGTSDAVLKPASPIKIIDAAIKIILITMDLDGEDFFPFNFPLFLGRVWQAV
jgi:hypothetical protein